MLCTFQLDCLFVLVLSALPDGLKSAPKILEVNWMFSLSIMFQRASLVFQHFPMSFETSRSGSKNYFLDKRVNSHTFVSWRVWNLLTVLFSREVSFDMLRKARPQLSLIMNSWKTCHLYRKLRFEKQASTHHQNWAFKKKDYWIKLNLLCHSHQLEKHPKWKHKAAVSSTLLCCSRSRMKKK